jgi:hypothetical protein
MADELVEGRPPCGVERGRKQQYPVQCAYARQLRQRALVVVDVFDDVQTAHQIERAVRERQ